MKDPGLSSDLIGSCVRFTRWVRAQDHGAAMTPPQASALAVLIHGGPMRVSDLAAYEHVTPASISVTVAQLVKSGLVERARDPRDGRSLILKPTLRGKAAFDTGQRRHNTAVALALNRLTDEEREALRIAADVLLRVSSQPLP